MADSRVQDLLEHVAAGEQSQELRQQLLQLLEEKQLQLEALVWRDMCANPTSLLPSFISVREKRSFVRHVSNRVI